MGASEKLDLKEHISSKEKKQRYVNRLFETIASRYDFFTAFMSYGMDRGWKHTMVDMAGLKGDEAALDIACGTGDITFEIARRLKQGRAIGLDITRRHARDRTAKAARVTHGQRRLSPRPTSCRFRSGTTRSIA